MSSAVLVTLVLGLVGTGGLSLFLKQVVETIRAARAPNAPPPPAPQAAAVVDETNDGNAALLRALTAATTSFDRLESSVARCSVPDCPVRQAHFRPKDGES